ncbi:MAG: PfkB family carbohydrate kinase [Phycisphaerales bacterium]
MSLLVAGTVCIDTIFTPAVHVENVLGGSCTYFAAAASFHSPVRMVAAVGEDFPLEHHQTLAHFRNIDASGLEVRTGSKTFRWGGKYHDNMDRRDSLFTELNVLGEAPPRIPEHFRDSRVVFLANMHPGTQAGMLKNLPKRRLVVADTMDFWINSARKELEALLRQVDGLVLNFDEAELFTGKRNPVTAAREILKFGPRFVVVKKGEHGALLIHRDGIGALPAYPAEKVIDPTGAGDTFAGGMMGALAANSATPAQLLRFDSILRALAHGTVIASFNIESFSLDRLKTLKPAELKKRYTEYCKMISVLDRAPKAANPSRRPARKPASKKAPASARRRMK